MERPYREGMAASLTRRVGPGAGAVQVAEAMSIILQQIDAALAPVIGARGVAALYKRSAHLACAAHRWLSVARDDPTMLLQVLAKRSDAEAVAGANAFLRSFDELLVSLIGSALTERLLHAVWVTPSSGIITQVTSCKTG
jgi:hypothetical protein